MVVRLFCNIFDHRLLITQIIVSEFISANFSFFICVQFFLTVIHGTGEVLWRLER